MAGEITVTETIVNVDSTISPVAVSVTNTSVAVTASDQGIQGAKGDQGDQGLSGVISVTAPITNSGTSTSANIGINAGVANGVATLDGSGLIPTSQLPPLAISDTFVVNSQAAMLALSAEVGDVAVRTDANQTFILQSSPPTTLGNWIQVLTPPAVTSVTAASPLTDGTITSTGTIGLGTVGVGNGGTGQTSIPVATAWVSGTTYAVGDFVTYQTAYYVRRVAGAGTTAPSTDTTNWAVRSFPGNLQGANAVIPASLVAYSSTGGVSVQGLVIGTPPATIPSTGLNINNGGLNVTAGSIAVSNSTNGISVTGSGGVSAGSGGVTTTGNITLGNSTTGGTLNLIAASGNVQTIQAQTGANTTLTLRNSSGTVAYQGDTIAVANGGTGATANTGTGNNVLSDNPTLLSPTISTSIVVPAASFTAFSAATTLNIGSTTTSTSSINPSTTAGTHSYSSGSNTGAQVKTINFANGAIGGTTANNTVNIGNGGITSTGAGFQQINIGTGSVSATASQAINIGSTSATARVVINNPQNAPDVQAGTTYTIPATTPSPNVVLTSATQVTLTLPASVAGKEIRILCQGAGGVISASSNVYPKTSRTLGTAILASVGSAVLVGDGTNWQVMI